MILNQLIHARRLETVKYVTLKIYVYTIFNYVNIFSCRWYFFEPQDDDPRTTRPGVQASACELRYGTIVKN